MATDRSEPDADLDLIVVGLGALGSATAYQAQRRGLQVLGIDRHQPPHGYGSSHAETRITRLAVGEGPQYLPFVAQSHEIWRELELASGQQLLHRCGGLIVTDQAPSERARTEGQRWADFVVETDRIARSAGIDFDILDPSAASTLLPHVRGLAGKRIGYEPTAGLVLAERAVAVQLAEAARLGATVHTDEVVAAVEPVGDRVEVTTDRARYRAQRVVLAAGPWTGDLADPVDADRLRVTRQVVFWFEVDDPAAFAVDAIPFLMWVGDGDEEYVALFPIAPGTTPAVKVLGEQFVEATHPETVVRTVDRAEIDAFHRQHIEPRFTGIGSSCVKAEVCLYTNTPDDHFLIDRSARSDRIVVLSPCSGHGFKHSAALGEAVAEWLIDGASTLDLTPFARRWG